MKTYEELLAENTRLLEAAEHFRDCWERHLSEFTGCKECTRGHQAIELATQ